LLGTRARWNAPYGVAQTARLRWGRSLSLACLASAFVCAVIVYAASGKLTPADSSYLAMAAFCAALIPAVRRVSRRWLVEGAVGVGSLVVLLVIADPNNVLSDQGTSIMMYSAAPLVCGVVFVPRWEVYALLCLLHATRAVIELGLKMSIGVMPRFVISRDMRRRGPRGRQRVRARASKPGALCELLPARCR
jgi:hypothetical protein